MTYEFTPAMGEISGFGGDYEDSCRAMLRAGLEFWDQQPAPFGPRYEGLHGVFGLCMDTNADARLLDAAIMKATIVRDGIEVVVGGEATGAMHQAVVQSLFWIRKNGWDAYVREMSKSKEESRV